MVVARNHHFFHGDKQDGLTADRRRSRVDCDAELTAALLAAKFFQGLGIEGVLVCFKCFSPLLH
jgi:hypothetical protein